jgi:putative copper resistance protein D
MTPLVLCRFAHFIAALPAFGASAYLWLYAPANLRHALSPAIGRLLAALSVVALVTAVLWLALEAASMADDWSDATDPGAIAAVLTDTSFGRAWIARLLLAAALVAVALTMRGHWATKSILSGLLLASLALVGHAAMQAGAEGLLHRCNDALHLLAAGAWLGGLVVFVLCLAEYADAKLGAEAGKAMMRFSLFGHFVVATIVATGAVNIALISGHPPWPPTTPYRLLLDAKIAVVAIMILLAVYNRYWLVPRLKRRADALVTLSLTSTVEVALGTVVLALVSVFALLDPA